MNESSARYHPRNVLDNDISTAWCVREGTGDTITLDLPGEYHLDRLSLRNGYQKVKNDTYGDRFYHNCRVKRATLTFSDGATRSVTLVDQKSSQDVDLGDKLTDSLRLRIDSAYYGNDTPICLTEMDLYGYK